jgi:hypothetical protein
MPCPAGDRTPTMKTCHQSQHAIVAPTTPAFTAAPTLIAIAPPRVTAVPVVSLAAPHAAPAPSRPEAQS